MARRKNPPTDTAADLRPIAKKIVKHALRVYDVAKEALVEAGEQFDDLVSEARAEMKADKPPKVAKGQKRKKL